MGESKTGKITYPHERWNTCPEESDMRQVVKLRAAILNFESAAKTLLEAYASCTVSELIPVATHVHKQAQNSIAYAKSVFAKLQSLGDTVYDRSKMAKINESRKNYVPARGPSK